MDHLRFADVYSLSKTNRHIGLLAADNLCRRSYCTGQGDSVVSRIKDATVFLKTIKETPRRADAIANLQ